MSVIRVGRLGKWWHWTREATHTPLNTRCNSSDINTNGIGIWFYFRRRTCLFGKTRLPELGIIVILRLARTQELYCCRWTRVVIHRTCLLVSIGDPNFSINYNMISSFVFVCRWQKKGATRDDSLRLVLAFNRINGRSFSPPTNLCSTKWAFGVFCYSIY